MCCLWKNEEKDIKRPSLKEWKEFIASLNTTYDSGFTVIFGGGEPLLLPDMLTELISTCHQRGFRTSLATSGYFIDETMAKRLAESGLDYIALTLYSLKEEIHNYLRGMPDSHRRLMQAIEYLDKQRNPLEIAIDTVIMAPNLGELLELANWVRKDDRISSLFFQAVVQPFHSPPKDEWYNSEEYKFLWPKESEQVDLFIDGLIKIKENSPRDRKDKINNSISQLKLFKHYFKAPQDFIKKTSCSVLNDNAFTVSPDGSVNLCPYIKPIGNICDGNLKDIWYSKEAHERREEILHCKKNCHHIINCWYEEEPSL
ncbi:MAG: radical SAM protein [Candidatus Omnitrophica bacterium]|nr:radical SAM protein [Candidatus Omnitrophota bacterium]